MSSLSKRLLFTGFSGVVISVLAIISHVIWARSSWFTLTHKRGVGLYTNPEFYAYIVYCFLSPVALYLVSSFLQTTTRMLYAKATIWPLVLWSFVPLAIYGAIIGWNLVNITAVWECGFFFCLNSDTKTREFANDWYSVRGTGYMHYFALQWIASVGIFGIAVLANIFSAIYYKVANSKDTSGYTISLLTNSDAKKSKYTTTFDNTWTYVSYAIYSVILILFFIGTLYIPNQWRNWEPARMASAAMLYTESDAEICRAGGSFTCPEYGHAWFKTSVIKVSKYLNLRLYPSNLLMLGFIFFFPLAVVLLRLSPFDKITDKMIRVPGSWTDLFNLCLGREVFPKYLPPHKAQLKADEESRVASVNGMDISSEQSRPEPKSYAFVSVKEILAILATLTLVVLVFIYWFQSHNFKGRWPRSTPWLSDKLYRTFGQIAVTIMSLLLFPAARNSPVLSLLGISWEQAIKYHRWLGVFFLFALFGHIAFAIWYYYQSDQLSLIYMIPAKLGGRLDDWTIPIISYVSYASFITLGYMGTDSFRRKNYNIFLFAHHVTVLIMIPITLLHAAAGWEYILPGAAIWIVDRGVRAYRTLQRVDIAYVEGDAYNKNVNDIINNGEKKGPSNSGMNNINNSGNIHSSTSLSISSSQRSPGICAINRGKSGKFIEFKLSCNGFKYLAGQYAFLNVAEISLTEWHPMTIASAPEEDSVMFTIKVMSENRWTGSLFDYIYKIQHADGDDSQNLNAEGYSPNMYLPVPITISMDGPYGQPLDYSKYDTVILVGAGVGYTPTRSVYQSLYMQYLQKKLKSDSEENDKQVHLYFFARDVTLFNSVISPLADLSPESGFTADLICTQDTDEQRTMVDSRIEPYIQYGRSPLDLEKFNEKGKRVLVFTCGPQSLIDECQEICIYYDWTYHHETFDL